MNIAPDFTTEQPETKSAQAWVRTLAKYREPSTKRSFFELAVTVLPFLALWGLAWAACLYGPRSGPQTKVASA